MYTMNKSSILTMLVLDTSVMSFTRFKPQDNDCKIMHKGTFVYGNEKSKVRVEINGKNHIEYHDGGKYIIKSKLDWVSDCEYNMTMSEVTIPNFPYNVGDVMNVKINKVEGNEIFYTSTVHGESWEGKFTKVNK